MHVSVVTYRQYNCIVNVLRWRGEGCDTELNLVKCQSSYRAHNEVEEEEEEGVLFSS